ncbi:hypothetical protein [Sphingomonas phyllosphaerae]|uniref:hypothetical protein n=1 Tax=Sphingomonas phyllosphaerae TaxID=257003 RepID=UPI0003B6FD09|nr:hypothetical protein [Sphingomonas phyllosphaerae]
MIALQVAGLIADFYLFLELTGDDDLDPDTAVKMTESLAYHLGEMDHAFLRELVDAFAVVAENYTGDEVRETVRNIASDLYLEETLAGDDPVKLAELEALRDARA